jgi:hypothetical protein
MNLWQKLARIPEPEFEKRLHVAALAFQLEQQSSMSRIIDRMNNVTRRRRCAEAVMQIQILPPRIDGRNSHSVRPTPRRPNSSENVKPAQRGQEVPRRPSNAHPWCVGQTPF